VWRGHSCPRILVDQVEERSTPSSLGGVFLARDLVVGLDGLGAGERRCQLVRLESERAGLALVGDPALGVDEIDAVGPTCVRLFGRVAKFVQNGGNPDAESADTGSGDQCPLLLVFRAREYNFVFEVALHLPDVAGMCFGDVDNQEGNAASILIVKLVESGNLPPEGRSGVTAKYEHNGLLLVQGGELNSSGFVEPDEREVGSAVANV